MNKKSIILVQPSKKILGELDDLYTYESLTPSLGLAMIGAVCREKGYKASVVDLRLPHWTLERLFVKIKEEDPVFVGISAFTNEIVQAGFLAKALKAAYPDIPIIVGGPHASAIPRETLEEFPDFDIAVMGEGERTILALMELLKSQGNASCRMIPGIAFRLGDDIFVNSPAEEIPDLDTLPYPAWDLFELPHYNKWFALNASRGCPYLCYFCNPAYLGRSVRIKSPVRICNEIEDATRRFGISSIQFADAMLTLNKRHTMEMCEELIARKLHIRIRWECETRADSVERGLLRKMKQAGCRWIAMGVETGNEEILKNVIKKQETKQQIIDAVRAAHQEGLKVRCFFTIGHYGETVSTIKETIRFAVKLNPDSVSFSLLLPNPGTEIRALAEKGEGGLRILNNNWMHYNQLHYDIFELETIPLAELKEWQSRAYFTFHFYHPLRALGLLFSRSVYNYKIKGIVLAVGKLLSRMFSSKH